MGNDKPAEKRTHTDPYKSLRGMADITIQSAVYLLLMNAAVLFGTLTLMKENETLKGSGPTLVLFPCSSLFTIVAYILLAFAKADTFGEEFEEKDQKFYDFIENMIFGGVGFLFISLIIFFIGCFYLIVRLVNL